MITSDFVAFYSAIHGCEPLSWQKELAQEVVEGGWPGEVPTPMGSGKTALLDIAVWALAMQADRDLTLRTAARRIFFVVQQRAVVDAVYRYAARIEEALRHEEAPVLAQVAGALRRLHGRPQPLTAASLRGGRAQDDTWARHPDQPLICVTTIDQVGSRLLFRGYGVSPYQRSIHAGLVGTDALLLVDDGPRAAPFLGLLEGLKRFRRPEEGLSVVSLSGRPPVCADGDFMQRLTAPKITALAELGADDLVATLVKEAVIQAEKKRRGVQGIFVNKADTAWAVWQRLEELLPGAALLLTGRSRPLDRARLHREQEKHAHSIVVAAGGVEGDPSLDFATLITEMAPLDQLRRRFLHLDWRGAALSSSASVFYVKGDRNTKEAWQLLCSAARGAKKDRTIDLSALNFCGLVPVEPPVLQAPVVLLHHMESWVQTAPTPAMDPVVGPFLRGIRLGEEEIPEGQGGSVHLVWRKGASTPSEASAQVQRRAPVSGEALTVPLKEVQAWLRLRAVKSAFSWLGSDAIAEVPILNLQAGATLILPTALGGCDRFGWAPESTASVTDLSEEAQSAARREEEQLHLHRPEVLERHGKETAVLVRQFAESCGLPLTMTFDLVLAAELHDLGLEDLRLRLRMQNSAPGWFGSDACPAGLRHELLSVVRAQALGCLQEATDPELVLHLIGTHHGRGRPIPPPQPSESHGLDRWNSGWVDRFWALNARYGYWRLAFLEAILRLANHRQAEAEASRGAT